MLLIMLNAQQIQLQKKDRMSNLQDYFQLKNQWKTLGCRQGVKQYRHIYSRQQIEQHSLNGVNIKQLDIFTSRENYSFPFCPKIYKCSIINSTCSNSTLSFDIALIAEKLNHQPERNHIKKVQQVDNIVVGFQYLFKRYGPFLITHKMIGWSQYNVPKVWFNQHFLSPQIQQHAQSQQQMVRSLLAVIEEMFQIKFIHKNINKFRTLIEYIDKNQYKRNGQEKKVKFNGLDISRYSSSNKSSESLFPRKLNKITFVYSNKTIHSKSHERQSQISADQLKQQRQNYIQFDKRSKRSKSSNQSINRKTEQFKAKMQLNTSNNAHQQYAVSHQIHPLSNIQNSNKCKLNQQQIQQQQQQQQKQNIQIPKRKSTKHLTCNFNDQPTILVKHHSRRYSNSSLLQQQNNMENLTKTEEKFNIRRKQSLLRQQLQQCLDNLFSSDKQVAEFDEKELEKELDWVL